MAIDAYALCPGGTGKKVKFCCSDLVSELDKLGRMIDGDQRQASLDHLDRLLKKHPGRACLLTVKANLERHAGRDEDAEKTLSELLAGQPQNPVALAEAAALAVRDRGGLAAMPALQQALAAANGQFSTNLLEALIAMFAALLQEGQQFAARRFLMLYLQATQGQDQQALQMLLEVDAQPFSLLLKDHTQLSVAPAGAPYEEPFNEAAKLALRGAFSAAAEKFTQLAGKYPDVPAIQRNVAITRSCLAENAAAAAAWRKYASLGVPADEAIEAEATAQTLDLENVADTVDRVRAGWQLNNLDECLARLSADGRCVAIAPEQYVAEEEAPPPRAGFALLDRAMPASAEGLTFGDAPLVLGRCWIFGKQTDREARVEVEAWREPQLPAASQAIAAAAGDALGAKVDEQVVLTANSLNVAIENSRLLPSDATYEQREQFAEWRTREGFLEGLSRLSLKLFDGRTPDQAAGDSQYKLRLAGLALALESVANLPANLFDFNLLRERWKLAPAAPLVVTAAEAKNLPPARFVRLDAARLDDDTLIVLLNRAASVNATEGLRRLGLETIARPGLAEKRRGLSDVYRSLIDIDSPQRALEHLERGRDLAVKEGQSSAAWDVLELRLRMQRGDMQRVEELFQHLMQEHKNEAGVSEALASLLYEFGLIDETGRPVGGMGGGEPGEPAIVGAEAGAAQQGKIWTPESERPQKGGLWLPGMG